MVELNASELARRAVQEFVTNLERDKVYRLEELIDEYGEGLTLCVDVDYWYDDCEVNIRLSVDRLETDEEYESRIEKLKLQKAKNALAAEKRRKANEARKAAKESEERKLYETLRRKFEGK